MLLLDTEASPFSGVAAAGLLAIYFIPAFAGRKKRQSGAILALNLLLGWTVLGWIGALIWAISKDAPVPAPVPVQPAPVPAPQPGVADELVKLQALRERGILSETEFQQQRHRLLNRPA